MKTYTIYGQTGNEKPFPFVTLTGNFAPQVFDTLYDYVIGQFDYLYEDWFAKEESDE